MPALPGSAPDRRRAYEGRRVCVTGGAGFIGSHLCDALVGAGAEVAVIDDLSHGLEENLAAVADRVRLVRGSILDPDALASAVDGAEIVFHLAALASVPRSVKEPEEYFRVNATGTLHVLDAARRLGAKRVVFAASSSAYGDQPGLPRVETMAPDIRSPYAAAKCAAEHLVRAFAHCYEISTVSLRYFNIFGPRQRPDSPYAAVVPLFVSALREGRASVIYGDGTQTRDFTFVANAVAANMKAGAAERDLRGEVLNVACGERRSVMDILRAIAGILGVEARFQFAPPRVGEVQHSIASVEAARELIGYAVEVGFEAGLREAVGWYVEARA